MSLPAQNFLSLCKQLNSKPKTSSFYALKRPGELPGAKGPAGWRQDLEVVPLEARDSSRDRRVRLKNEEKIILFPHTFVYVGFFCTFA